MGEGSTQLLCNIVIAACAALTLLLAWLEFRRKRKE